MRSILIIILSLILTGCGSYSSKFTCPDAKGFSCEMVHSVDHKIDNWGIEEFYRCENKKCNSKKK